MAAHEKVQWPEELRFMLRDLVPGQLVMLKQRTIHAEGSPEEGWTGQARFNEREKALMESLIAKLALADLPHRDGTSLVQLMGLRVIYPGDDAEVTQSARSSDGENFWIIRYHFWDHGPYR